MELEPKVDRVVRLGRIRDEMMAHLGANLDSEIRKRLSGPQVRELISHLAEWVLDRDTEVLAMAAEATVTSRPLIERERQRAVREALKPTVEQSSFLDAIDEIR